MGTTKKNNNFVYEKLFFTSFMLERVERHCFCKKVRGQVCAQPSKRLMHYNVKNNFNIKKHISYFLKRSRVF